MFKEMNIYKQILITIAVVLILFLAATFAFPDKVVGFLTKLHLKSEKTLSLDKVYSRNLTSDMRVCFRDGHIYYHKDGTLVMTGMSDEELMRRDFEAKTANVLFKDKYIYSTDAPNGIVNILSYDDLKDVKDFNYDEAISFIDEKGGRYTAWLSDNFNETLRAYDDDFTERFRYKALNPILTYNVDKDFKTMQIASFDPYSSEIKASLYKEINRKGENKLYYKFNDEVIAFIADLKDMKLVATNKALYYMQEDAIVFKKEYNTLKDIAVDGSKVYLLADDKLMTLNNKAEVIDEHTFNQNVKSMLKYNNDYIVYSEREIYIPYKAKYYMKDIQEDIRNIYVGGGFTAVVSDENITIYSIKIA